MLVRLARVARGVTVVRVAVVRVAVVAVVAAALLPAACSSDSPATASADPRQNVMVIDEGFDVTAADIQGKVVAAFTLDCQQPAGGGAGDAGTGAPAPSFDEAKRQLLAELAMPDQSCTLHDGISAKSDPLASIARYRDRWNAMLRSQRRVSDEFNSSEAADLRAAIEGEFQTFRYHGTATAGTVAHENPAVRLVLVERAFAQGSPGEGFNCISPAEIEQATALLTDPDVRAAYANRPPAPYQTALDDAANRYHVGMVNESFGRLPRALLEMLQMQLGCPTIDLGPYFTAMAALEQSTGRSVSGIDGHVLVVQAAGNESTQIDGPSDALDCAPGDPMKVMVGSYDANQVRSAFSNFGACVDLYAPGEDVIAPYAGGWLLPVSGTSFSAPLVARSISLTAPTPYDPVQAREALLAQRDASGNLPVSLFPADFFYRPGVGTNNTVGPLRAEGAGAGDASMRGRVPRARFDSDGVLWPIARLRGGTGRVKVP